MKLTSIMMEMENLHLIPSPAAPGVNGTEDVNVHSIAMQIPKTLLTSDGSNPTNESDPRSVIGIYASASRRKMRMLDGQGGLAESGPFVQVSRLGNPLFNEVIVPMGEKDLWNALSPSADSQFVQNVLHPEVSALLPLLYPNVFPNLASYQSAF